MHLSKYIKNKTTKTIKNAKYNKYIRNSKHNKHSKTIPTKQKLINIVGGSMCDDKNKKYISYLIHGTSIDNFRKILEDGKLKPNRGDRLKNGNIMNKGVFMQLVFDCNKEQTIFRKDCRSIYFVFSDSLLSRDDYHINNNHCGGLKRFNTDKSCKSYTKDNILGFLSENEQKFCSRSLDRNEIIFQNEVNLDDLLEIWICNFPSINNFVSIKTNAPNNNLTKPQYIRQEQEQIIDEYFIKYIRDCVKYYLPNINIQLINSIPKSKYNENDTYCDSYGKNT
jgi:hypothetical protein